ncbi:MAG: FAD-binding oxidoreductase [Thermomicrobiales bacterium]|nr:FAD-binding oxidoreductase [Thermomicrobiales bacterium]MCO5219771.1 FAD-binding oxidoreductase [Thermomicrobiales bacterium]MCO5225253.1 FAD-binding oxidoreductase [Thermomicrobiales bacterium]MCO5229033.1 FAD-binding oxidoreductase [Thermomicrobiales bacterium]
MTVVAVIGGGIVGASAAFHLALAGIETVLVDSATDGRATSAGAGIVAPGTSLRSTPGFAELARPAVTYYPELVRKLRDLGVQEPGYEVCGKLVVANTAEKAEQLPANTALFRQRHRDSMPNIGEIEEITPAMARELLPTLGDVLSAIYVPGAARVDGAKMRAALTEGARTLGARVILGSAELQVTNNQVMGISINGERISTDAVVLAAGAWTNQALLPLGATLPIDPQKGQIIHIDMPGQDTTHWPILDWSASQYQLSFGPSRVVCGATREFHSGYDLRVTPAGVKEILDEQLALCPGLAHGTIAEVRVGLRPYSADVTPFIGAIPGVGNLVISSGHGPSGLMLGPYSGLLAAELARGETPAIDLEPYRLDRPIVSAIPPA